MISLLLLVFVLQLLVHVVNAIGPTTLNDLVRINISDSTVRLLLNIVIAMATAQ